MANTTVDYLSNSGAYLEGIKSSDWLDLWNGTNNVVKHSDTTRSLVGVDTKGVDSNWNVWQSYFVFNTASIPPGNEIKYVILILEFASVTGTDLPGTNWRTVVHERFFSGGVQVDNYVKGQNESNFNLVGELDEDISGGWPENGDKFYIELSPTVDFSIGKRYVVMVNEKRWSNSDPTGLDYYVKWKNGNSTAEGNKPRLRIIYGPIDTGSGLFMGSVF